ncbi:MAG: hypothetical protein R2845_02075 [Thermomicrobiales bacterium]
MLEFEGEVGDSRSHQQRIEQQPRLDVRRFGDRGQVDPLIPSEEEITVPRQLTLLTVVQGNRGCAEKGGTERAAFDELGGRAGRDAPPPPGGCEPRTVMTLDLHLVDRGR